MLSKYKKQRIEYKLLTLAVIASAIFFVCKVIYAGVINLPYPKEILEPSNIALTNMFLEGRTPYSLESLSYKIPAINYEYPFLNSLLAAAIAKITGCGAVTAHFAISLTSILISGILGYAIVRRKAVTTVSPFLAAILFMFCHWRFGYISAAPDDLGLLLFILTMFAATSPHIKNKPLVCAIGTTLCFYTKQYFVFVAIGILIYMFLYSKKEALEFLVITLAINAAIAFLITYFWPVYWLRAFLFMYLGTIVGGGSQIATLIEQFRYIVVMFAALFAILIFSASMAVARLIKNNKKLREAVKIEKNDVFAMHVVQTIVMLIPLFIMGRNDGAFLSYFLQLWIPSVAVVTLLSFERFKPVKHELAYVAVYALIAASTIYFGLGKLPLHILTQEEIADWEKAYKYTRAYSEEGTIFYSRSLAYDGFARGNGQWQCGNEGDVNHRTIDRLTEGGITVSEDGWTQQLVDGNQYFRKKIERKAKSHGYALITFETFDDGYVFTEPYCDRIGYKCLDRLNLRVGNMPYEVCFYIPK